MDEKNTQKTHTHEQMTRLGLQVLLGVLTLLAIGICVIAIFLLVEKVQTEFWFRTLQSHELLEPAVDVRVLILNCKNQFFSATDQLDPVFGAQLSSCEYSAKSGSLSVQVQGVKQFFSRSKSGAFVLTPEPPVNCILRIQLSAGNNRGYIVWFDLEQNKTYWLLDASRWLSSMPSTRPFVFLTSEPVA